VRRLLLLSAALLLVPSLGGAQQAAPASAPPAAATPAPQAPVVRIFEIRHADMQEVSLVVPTLLSDGNVLTVDAKSRTVTVVDRPEFVGRVESWLQQFDVPRQAVLVRIVLEKAERSGAQGDVPGWKYSPLAETTLEVLERGTATQSVGPDGAFEIRVRLGSVDAERGLLHFDEVAVRRRDAPGPGTATPALRDVFSTSIDAKDRVPKVVMATRDPSADVALVLRLLALIREQEPGG
jgi:hypothetical protein